MLLWLRALASLTRCIRIFYLLQWFFRVILIALAVIEDNPYNYPMDYLFAMATILCYVKFPFG